MNKIFLTFLIFFFSLESFGQNKLGTISISDSISMIFIGELHGFSNNKSIKFDLLKDLILKNNFRCLMIERGFSESIFINKYIRDDTIYTQEFFPRYDIYEFDFIDSLKYFLQKNNIENFEVVGINYENPRMTIMALKEIIYKTDVGFSNPLVLIKNSTFGNNSLLEIRRLIIQLKDDFKINETNYQYNLPPKIFISFIKILNSYEDEFVDVNFNKLSKKESIPDTITIKREKLIYKNILDYYISHPNVKSFGQFGLLHIPKINNTNWLNFCNWKSAISMLCEQQNIKNKIFTAVILYNYHSLFKSKFHSKKHVKTIGINIDTLCQIEKKIKHCKICWYDVKSINFDMIIVDNKKK